MIGAASNAGAWHRRLFVKLARVASRLWEGCLFFLALIGLYENRKVDQEAQLAHFRLRHAEFRNLLTANNSFLETIAELERKQQGREYFDLSYLEGKILRASADVFRMVESLNVISGERYFALRAARDGISTELARVIERWKQPNIEELVIDLDHIQARHAGLVGGKMANLGEIRNGVGLPTPDGFAVTTKGYQMLIAAGGGQAALHRDYAGTESSPEGDAAGAAAREHLLHAAAPPALAQAIAGAYERLAARQGAAPLVAVRSSALGEDSHLSFAGQFLTVLNVKREGLLKAYLQVTASLFSPEAVHYRRLQHVPMESTAMAGGFVVMVDAVASGVIFTKDPTQPDAGQILIHAVRGLGVVLVDGRTAPEVIRVARGAQLVVAARRPSRQTVFVVKDPESGVREAPLAPAEAAQPAITNEEALLLAHWALALESHFGGPQDIEWAVDQSRKLVLLQSRPLRVLAQAPSSARPVVDLPVLINGGDVGCPGVGIGSAVHLDETGDLDSFPDGGVLVAPRSSPKFVRVMAKARAIVTDTGSTTGHMASLAREFRIPTLLNTQSATAAIPPGVLVTVDAGGGRVYQGAAPELLEEEKKRRRENEPLAWIGETPSFRLLEAAAGLIISLNLSDPRSKGFTEASCRSLHDLARFIHEKSYEEMFRLGDRMGDLRAVSYYLDVFLPIDLYIIDLGHGISPKASGRKVKPALVTSAPLKALLAGMLDRRIQRFGPRPMDWRGFFTVMMRHALTNPEQERTFRDPCYALVSDKYLNYAARVGYHFGVVDSYCGATPNKNYITMHFRGGAADLIRRARRSRAIGGILQRSGFLVEVKGDVVSARLSKAEQEDIAAKLEMIGRLLQFIRQMDVAMATEESVVAVREAFLSGNYSWTGEAPEKSSELPQ